MIEMRNGSCRYPEREDGAVENISLHIAKGEFVVLSGSSGCGKSTLLKLMNGLVPGLQEAAVTGEIRIDGRPVAEQKSWELAELVGTVNQNPRSQFFTTNTTTELAFAMENLGWQREQILDRLRSLSEEAGIDTLMDRHMFKLSSGERQRVTIACALALRPKILLFDEPSANLDYAATLALGRLLEQLKARGHTIVIAEHRLFYLSGVCDRMLYLKDGRLEQSFSRKELTDLQTENLRSFSPFCVPLGAAKPHMGGDVLHTEGLTYKNLLRNIHLHLAQGEVLALVGRNGAGKTTLTKLLAGILKPDGGTVEAIDPMLVMQDADYQLFTESVWQELRLGAESLPKDDIRKTIQSLGLLGLESCHPITLSGGQKQRVLLGAAGLCKARLVILDEPTSGLDAQNMRRVGALIEKIRKEADVIVITHDFELIAAVCSRLVWLDHASIKADFPLNESVRNNVIKIFQNLAEEEEST